MPPPTTTRSNLSRCIAASASAREITARRLRQEGRVRAQLCALGRRLLLARGAEVEQAEDALVLRDVDRRPPLPRAQHLGGAPVGGQPATVGGEQHDVGRAGGGAEVLLVLHGVAL